MTQRLIHITQYLRYGSAKGAMAEILFQRRLGLCPELLVSHETREHTHDPKLLEILWKAGIRVHFVDSTYSRTPWQLESLKGKITALHREAPFVWITHGGFSALALSQLKISFLHICHGFGMQRPRWIDDQDREGIAAAHRIFPVSKDIYRQLQELGIDEGSLETVYYPLGFREQIRPKRSQIKELAVVGNLIPLKGQRFAIEALGLCLEQEPKAKFRLHLYGEGVDLVYLKTLVKDLHLQDEVIFHGFCDMEQEYEHFDLLLVPSLTEGLGMAILEAFEFWVPVCAFQTGGIPELVAHNESGLLCPTGDSEALAKNILTYYYHPEKIAPHVRWGRDKAKALFSPQKNSQILLDAAQLGLELT
jgi:glycosyltransferase involved in cell wall biosynthesis